MRAKTKTCAVPNCPYSGPFIRGLCRNCYSYTARWERANVTAWSSYVEKAEFRASRISTIGRGWRRRGKVLQHTPRRSKAS